MSEHDGPRHYDSAHSGNDPAEAGATVLAGLQRQVADQTHELAETRARYQSLVENLQDIIVEFDADGHVRRCHGNVLGILGYMEAELLAWPTEGGWLHDLVTAEDRPALAAALQQARNGYAGARRILRISDKADERRWIELTLLPLYGEAESPLGTQGIIRDVSDRIQTERIITSLNAAATVVQRASFSVEQVFEAVTSQFAELGFVSMVAVPDGAEDSLAIARVSGDAHLGVALRQLLGADALGIRLKIDALDALVATVRSRRVSFLAVDEAGIRSALPDHLRAYSRAIAGLLPPCRAILAPMVADDQMLGVLAVAGEAVTQGAMPAIAAFAGQTAVAIRNAQLVGRLAASEQQYRGIFESANDGFLVLDAQDQVVEANPAACAIYGYAHDELVGIDLARLIHVDDRPTLGAFAATVAGQGQFHTQLAHVHRDGSVFPAEMVGVPLSFHGQRHALAVITDITTREEAQDTLIRAERLRALGQMAGGIAHDFNNILVSIRGYADLALLDLEENSPLVRQDVERILSGANDAAEAIRRLQSLYRQSDDTSDFLSLDLDELVSQALILTRPRWRDQAQAQDITIQVHTVSGNPSRIHGNAGELRRVLTNLIVNAVDAMPAGGTLTLGTRQMGDWSEIEVRDTGVGMSAEQVKRVFEPFYTTKQSSGLGLTVSRNIIQRHGGEIQVESEPGRGACFLLRFPVDAEALRPAAPTLSQSENPSAGDSLRILIVDDEPAVRALLTRFLQRQGHRVTTVGSGGEALVILAEQPYDVLITDLGMPDVSGYQVARRAYELHPEAPIILSTGWGETIGPEQLEQMHITTLLAKPFTHDDLSAAMARVHEARCGVR